jgi:hypothetical protein
MNIAQEGLKMNEEILKSSHDAKFLVSHLLDANRKASAVESIIVMELIRRAANLKADIEILLNALEESEA